MSHSAAERLHEIERILSQRKASPPQPDADAVSVHLADIPSDRIQELTAALQQRSGETIDDIDAIVMRLLLNDYANAVAHLRAVAQTSASRIDAAAAPVRASQAIVRQQLRREEKQRIKRQQSGGDVESPT